MEDCINKVLKGDCLEKLKELPDDSVDSIVTDPPYELGFMGKTWDNTGIANNPLMWAECLRVLKPGGYLLSFGGTRTYHRMACAIEDAGFEVRDMIEWVYGSGFPKSLNIGKAVDKFQGNEREVSRVRTDGSGNATSENNMYDDDHKFVATKVFNETKGTSEWEGWGTALKPAHEPICMARKPLAEKTVAENVLKYGTGGINIEESNKGERSKGCGELEEKTSGSLNFRNPSASGRSEDAPSVNAMGGLTQPKTNNHPTVKPIALMEYLIKMVTPKGGIVLDPFTGSGSTLVAAKQNGFQYVGIEMTAEYIPIIEARLNSVENRLL